MKDLIGKIGRFCENHVEKIVLVIVGTVCVWLFFTRVIFSPNGMAVDRTGKVLAPSQIDRYVYEQKAQDLRAKLLQQEKERGLEDLRPASRRPDRCQGSRDRRHYRPVAAEGVCRFVRVAAELYQRHRVDETGVGFLRSGVRRVANTGCLWFRT